MKYNLLNQAQAVSRAILGGLLCFVVFGTALCAIVLCLGALGAL